MRIDANATGFSPVGLSLISAAPDPALVAPDSPDGLTQASPTAGGAIPAESDKATDNPFATALAASSILPLANSAATGPTAIETFSATASAGVGSIFAVVTKASHTLAVIDSAGNVSVQSPASDQVRQAMSQLSDPAERSKALADLLGGTVQLASGQTNTPDLKSQLRALAAPASSADAPGTASVSMPAASSASPSQVAQADAAFAGLFAGSNDSPEAMMKSLTSDGIDGYWKWQLQQLTAKITGEVMAEQGLTRDAVEKMPPEQRAALEDAIVKEVERRVKQIVAEDMKKKENQTEMQPSAAVTPNAATSAPSAQSSATGQASALPHDTKAAASDPYHPKQNGSTLLDLLLG
jgi:hypothetical protein